MVEGGTVTAHHPLSPLSSTLYLFLPFWVGLVPTLNPHTTKPQKVTKKRQRQREKTTEDELKNCPRLLRGRARRDECWHCFRRRALEPYYGQESRVLAPPPSTVHIIACLDNSALGASARVLCGSGRLDVSTLNLAHVCQLKLYVLLFL